MRAMSLAAPGQPLQLAIRRAREPQAGEVLIRVTACGVCRTDLHLVDGELPSATYPRVPGHEIVGQVVRSGPGVDDFTAGQRVGVPWLGGTCGQCRFCRSGRENLCNQARFTGCHLDGGYAGFVTADARHVFALPDGYTDVEAAPLLCAGLIGYRALKMAGDGKRLGIYGFGAAAHIVAQVAVWQQRDVFAFTRPGDVTAQAFARSLGAVWAGDSTQPPPLPLDAALIFAPVGSLVPAALATVDKGGIVVCAGIHMSDIPAFPYALLWGERRVQSVANLTREDAIDFLALAPRVPVRTHVELFALEDANDALAAVRAGGINGAAVVVPTSADHAED